MRHVDNPTNRGAARSSLLVAAAIFAAVVAGVLFAGPIRSGVSTVWDGVFGADDAPTPQASDRADGVTLYQSGMHPWIITTEPGNCPICGMKLEPIDPAKLTGELAIDPTVVQNMGVRVQPVIRAPLERTIRTVGTVTYDETKVRTVNTKIDGWIEDLYVDSVGERVEAGDPLFSVYSPKLYAAQEEYLAAFRNRPRPGPRPRNRDLTSPDPRGPATAPEGTGDTLLDAAAARLRYLDITEQQLRELEQRGQPLKAIVIESPFSGVVTQKHANEGMRIDPGMDVFTLADLSEVWVLATVYEQQLPFVEQGAGAVMSLPYLPGRTIDGTVDYIYPYLEQQGREVKVRLVFDNAEGVLKPGMFANVRITSRLEDRAVLVPREAVIDTGERQIAFVRTGRGRFEKRGLRLGVEADDGQVQVIEGLEPGEQVVTSGQFLLDSESNLRESLAKMAGADLAATQPAMAAPAVAEVEPALPPPPVPPEVQRSVDRLVTAYLDVQAALTRNELEIAKRRIAAVADAAGAAGMPVPSPDIAKTAADMADAGSLEAFRAAFEPLSHSVQTLVEAAPPTAEATATLYRAYCPMVDKPWLQAGEAVRNPYAPYMLSCGSIEQRLVVRPAAGPRTQPAPDHAGH